MAHHITFYSFQMLPMFTETEEGAALYAVRHDVERELEAGLRREERLLEELGKANRERERLLEKLALMRDELKKRRGQ